MFAATEGAYAVIPLCTALFRYNKVAKTKNADSVCQSIERMFTEHVHKCAMVLVRSLCVIALLFRPSRHVLTGTPSAALPWECHTQARHDPNDFRRNRLYKRDVHEVFFKCLGQLKRIFSDYVGTEVRATTRLRSHRDIHGHTTRAAC